MFDRAKLLADLEVEEGLERLLYDDATGKALRCGDRIKGNPTLGIGWNVSAFALTDDQYRTICGWIVDAKAPPLYAALPWLHALPEDVQRGVADMAFNLGLVSFLTFTTFIGLLKTQNFEGAADDLETTLWFKQVGTRGPKIQALIRNAGALA